MKKLKNCCIQYWFQREAGLARKLFSQGHWFCRELVLQGIWFRRETGSTGKLVPQESWFCKEAGPIAHRNWFRRQTSFARTVASQRKLASQRNWLRRETGFLLQLLKFLSLYLWWKKLLIMQKLVTLQFCDF